MIAVLCHVVDGRGVPGVAYRASTVAYRPVECRDTVRKGKGLVQITGLHCKIKIHPAGV